MNHDTVSIASASGDTPIPVITSTPVADNERSDFFAGLFPGAVMIGEMTVYANLDNLSVDYNGGYWEFYRLSNEGRYLAPAEDKRFRIQSENGFSGTVSADAAGVIATLYTLSTLSFRIRNDTYNDRYYQLRDFTKLHPEASSIFSAID